MRGGRKLAKARLNALAEPPRAIISAIGHRSRRLEHSGRPQVNPAPPTALDAAPRRRLVPRGLRDAALLAAAAPGGPGACASWALGGVCRRTRRQPRARRLPAPSTTHPTASQPPLCTERGGRGRPHLLPGRRRPGRPAGSGHGAVRAPASQRLRAHAGSPDGWRRRQAHPHAGCFARRLLAGGRRARRQARPLALEAGRRCCWRAGAGAGAGTSPTQLWHRCAGVFAQRCDLLCCRCKRCALQLLLHLPRGHTPACFPSSFTAGRLLASHGVEKDNQLVLWSPASGRQLGRARTKGAFDGICLTSETQLLGINRESLVRRAVGGRQAAASAAARHASESTTLLSFPLHHTLPPPGSTCRPSGRWSAAPRPAAPSSSAAMPTRCPPPRRPRACWAWRCCRRRPPTRGRRCACSQPPTRLGACSSSAWAHQRWTSRRTSARWVLAGGWWCDCSSSRALGLPC